MKEVEINIKSKQKFSDGSSDKINLDVLGHYNFKNDKHYIIYKEKDKGLKDVKTILRFNEKKEKILLKRTKPNKMKQIFDMDKDCNFIYNTGHYKMNFKLKTNDLQIITNKKSGEIIIEYDLIQQNNIFSKNTLKLTYRFKSGSENDDK